MREINLDHVIDCSIDTYWKEIIFNEAYNHKLFHEVLQFVEWRDEVTKDNADVLERTVVVRPPVGEIPSAARKVLGDNFGYKEFGKFDRKARRYHVDVETNAVKDKTRIQGDIWLERHGDSGTKSRRRMVFTIEVKIMVVGRLIEDVVAKDMTRSFERGASFTNEWIREKGLV